MLDVGAGGAVCTNQKPAFSGWHHAQLALEKVQLSCSVQRDWGFLARGPCRKSQSQILGIPDFASQLPIDSQGSWYLGTPKFPPRGINLSF